MARPPIPTARRWVWQLLAPTTRLLMGLLPLAANSCGAQAVDAARRLAAEAAPKRLRRQSLPPQAADGRQTGGWWAAFWATRAGGFRARPPGGPSGAIDAVLQNSRGSARRSAGGYNRA